MEQKAGYHPFVTPDTMDTAVLAVGTVELLLIQGRVEGPLFGKVGVVLEKAVVPVCGVEAVLVW